MTGWPLPQPDLDSAPFWDGLRRREILIQQCVACGRRRFPPRAVCWQCGAVEWTWEPAERRASVVTWTVTHQAFGPAFRDEVPYTVLVVRLTEGADLLMYGNLRGADPTELYVGMPLQAEFEDREGVTVLQWRPAPSSAGARSSDRRVP